MDTLPDMTLWIAGIIEGEGSFVIKKNGGIQICCTMTDADVLEELMNICGGNLIALKKRKEHWKDSWRWSINGVEAYDLTKKIFPFLFSRRKTSALKMLSAYENSFMAKVRARQEKIKILGKNKKRTHQSIADEVGVCRSHVTHILLNNQR